jgi:hypothetical protein
MQNWPKNTLATTNWLASKVYQGNCKHNTQDIRFLLSFKIGNPDWNLTDTKQLQHLPAVKWKLKYIQTLAE